MLRKVPPRAAAGDRALILNYLEQSPPGAEGQRSLFPHDSPLEVSW